LMNDFATYEIFWHWLWTALHHRATLTQPGASTKAGDKVTPELMGRLLDERTKAVEAYFADQDAKGIVSRFDRSKEPLVMDLLRQLLKHPCWFSYGSPVLLSIIEAEPAERVTMLTAIFSPSREAVVTKVQRGELPPVALTAYDYVYDALLSGN